MFDTVIREDELNSDWSWTGITAGNTFYILTICFLAILGHSAKSQPIISSLKYIKRKAGQMPEHDIGHQFRATRTTWAKCFNPNPNPKKETTKTVSQLQSLKTTEMTLSTTSCRLAGQMEERVPSYGTTRSLNVAKASCRHDKPNGPAKRREQKGRG